MKKAVVILTCLLVIALVALGVKAQQRTSYMASSTDNCIKVGQAIDYLDEMERSHQQVLNNPELITKANSKLMGDLKFHKEMVKRYKELKKLILSK